MDNESRLGLLASAILEGRRIDWPTVESTADPDDRAIIEQLQIVAEIAAMQRHADDAGSGSATAESAPGAAAQSVWGHLRLIERVGRGTFGDVYRAWDEHLDREVALKLLRATPITDDPSASLSDPLRVVNEGRLLARVRHPHVITVYGAEPRAGTVGIWMEFIRGRTLHEIVAQQGPMGAREAVAAVADLCRALAAVHHAGLLHRDLTARNVMREEGGRLVLMDFGAGHEHAPERQGREMTGTPLYMAPELFTGGCADQRTDIYALGVLLYYLVTGRFPVEGPSLSAIGQAHTDGRRVRLRDRRADLRLSFVQVVEKALAAEPAHRYGTAGEFEAAIESALSTGTRPRSKWVGGAAAVGLAAVAAIGTWLVASAPAGPGQGQTGADTASPLAGLTVRKLSDRDDFWAFSNPSDDGRVVAGLVTQTGDVGLMDLTSGQYRALGMGRGDYSDGYASLGAVSPDGSFIAVDWFDDEGGSLRLIRADGTGARILVPGPDHDRAYQWSRDGSMILALTKNTSRTYTIGLVAAADGAVRAIARIDSAPPEMMSLSHDGRYIAYDRMSDPTGADRDIYILDTHTSQQWPLGTSEFDDVAPFWTPDGRALVFLSDRNRNASLWLVDMVQGRPQGPPRMIKDDMGRVWLRGFTRAGALHYDLSAGFAEIYVATLQGGASSKPQPLSPREALSNFYPEWSSDARYIAYASERGGNGRELWVFDTALNRESRVPALERIGRPFGWSPDGRQILATGPGDGRTFVVDRETGRTQLIGEGIPRATWGTSGIVYRTNKAVVVYDALANRDVRTFRYDDPSVVSFNPSGDGRSVMSLDQSGRVSLRDIASGATREWQESGAAWLGNHFMVPHAPGVAYVLARRVLNGEERQLMFWGGSGEPRLLLRAAPPEEFSFTGWAPDGLNLLVIRWTRRATPTSSSDVRTLWRVPITGGAPVSTGLAMEGLRDISIDHAGRLAFNAGWKAGDPWVMENLLPH